MFHALEPALYFSLVSFSTLGFGDIILDEKWRLLSGLTAANVATLTTAAGANLALTNAGTTGVALTVGAGRLAGALTGAGSLIKVGTGTLTLTAANTQLGGTTLANGTLALDFSAAGAAAADILPSAGTLNLAGGTLAVTGKAATATYQTALRQGHGDRDKGAMVLHMLRQMVGDTAFFDGMTRFYLSSRFRKVGSEDFRFAMEEASNRTLDRFFERWVYGAALPQVTFTSK